MRTRLNSYLCLGSGLPFQQDCGNFRAPFGVRGRIIGFAGIRVGVPIAEVKDVNPVRLVIAPVAAPFLKVEARDGFKMPSSVGIVVVGPALSDLAFDVDDQFPVAAGDGVVLMHVRLRWLLQ